MARRKKKRTASAGDIREIASGKASASDKREMGFVKKKGRLVPGPSTPAKARAAHKRRTKKKRKK